MPKSLAKSPRCSRADAEDGRLSLEQLRACSPKQLRARAERLLRMLCEFRDDELKLVLLELAAKMIAEADALKRKG